jgi:hypothetical protein
MTHPILEIINRANHASMKVGAFVGQRVRKQQGVSRGRYGPHPTAIVPRKIIWLARLEAFAVGGVARLGLGPGRRTLRELSDDEGLILEDAQSRVDFELVTIDCGLRGFHLCSCESVPGMRDLVELRFRAAGEPSPADAPVTISQRKGWLPLYEELLNSHVPFTRMRDGRSGCYLVNGVYGGEPIDHAYWYLTRHSLTFEVAGIVCELREEIRRGPGLATLLALARRIEQATLRKRGEADVAITTPGAGEALQQARI